MVDAEVEIAMDPPDSDDTGVHWLNIVPVQECWDAIQYPFVVTTNLNKNLYLGCWVYHPWYGNSQITEPPYVTVKYIVFNGQFESFGYHAGPFHATFITHHSMFILPPPPPVPASAAAIHTWWRVLRSYLHLTSHAEHEAEVPKELELLLIKGKWSGEQKWNHSHLLSIHTHTLLKRPKSPYFPKYMVFLHTSF